SYAVAVTVQDAGKLASAASFRAVVHNVPPQNVTWSGPLLVSRGQSLSFTGGFTDPGSADTHTAIVDWNDGSVTAATITGGGGIWQTIARHAYAAGGIYQVDLKVTDD